MKNIILFILLLNFSFVFSNCDKEFTPIKDINCIQNVQKDSDFSEILKSFNLENLHQLYEGSIGAESGGGVSSRMSTPQSQESKRAVALNCDLELTLTGDEISWLLKKNIIIQNSKRLSQIEDWEISLSKYGSEYKKVEKIALPINLDLYTVSLDVLQNKHFLDVCRDSSDNITECSTGHRIIGENTEIVTTMKTITSGKFTITLNISASCL